MEDKRRFVGSICVRFDTKRCKIELAPAEDYGGEPGFYRVRLNRRWHDGPNGDPAFFDQAQLGALVASLGFGQPPVMENAPDIPRGSRVSISFWHNDRPYVEGTWTATPPIRAHDSLWYVGVMTASAGFMFVPVKNVQVRPNGRSRRITQPQPQKTAA